jgi:group I intron endonuclease
MHKIGVHMANVKKIAILGKSGIYRIQNLRTGNFYIGSSNNILRRYWQHKTRLKNNNHWNLGMNEDFLIYGKHSFLFGVVEYCEKNELLDREQYYINIWNPSYNKRVIVNDPKSSWDKSSRKKLGEKLKKSWVIRKIKPGFKEKHAEARRGIPHTEETKKRLSEMRKGKPKSAEWKEKMRQRRKGTKLINGKFIKQDEVY